MRLTGVRLGDDAPDLVRFSSPFFSSSSSSSSSSLPKLKWLLILWVGYVSVDCGCRSLSIGLNESLKCISNKRLQLCMAVIMRLG